MTTTPAAVLDAAAYWIEQDPTRWGQGMFIGLSGCRCALGAVTYVLAPGDSCGDPTNLRDRDANHLGSEVTDLLVGYLIDTKAVAVSFEQVETVADWNDEPGRTPQQVVAVMRAAAAEWRDRQARRAARQAVTA